MSPAYLAADAARLADAELPRTVPVPLRTLPDTILQELDYAAGLIQRADEAIQRELVALEAGGVRLLGCAALTASVGLSQLAALVRIEAMRVRAGRTA